MNQFRELRNTEGRLKSRSAAWIWAATRRHWTLGIALLIAGASTLLLTDRVSFSSDGVALQNVLETWVPFHHEQFTMTPDTWMLKAPLYLLIAHLFSFLSPRHQLMLQSVSISLLTILLFYFAAVWFIGLAGVRRRRLTLLPIVWLASLGGWLQSFAINTDLRNVEIGTSLLLLALVFRVYARTARPLDTRRWFALALVTCAFCGFMIFNDPMFLWFFVVPVALTLVMLWFLAPARRRELYIVAAGVVLTLVAYALISVVARLADMHVLRESTEFAPFSQLSAQIQGAVQSLLDIFDADFTGRSLFSLQTLSALANFAILGIVAVAIWRAARAGVRDGRYSNTVTPETSLVDDVGELSRRYFCWLFVYMFVVYALSTLGVPGNTRYLVFLPYLGVLILIPVAYEMRRVNYRIVCCLLTVATLLNVAETAKTFHSTNGVAGNANSYQLALIASLRSHHLTQGYGEYWTAGITSFLSGQRPRVLPVGCSDGETGIYSWAVNQAQFDLPTKRSFLVLSVPDPGDPYQCTESQIDKQFGRPASMFTVSAYKVLIYDHNIEKEFTG